MVSLGIGTGFERSYHVLKRLGATPLGRPAADRRQDRRRRRGRAGAVRRARAGGRTPSAGRPSPANWPLAVCAVLLGTAAFAGIGLTLAGRLRGEINLAAQNGLYLVLLLLGGMVIPFAKLPGGIRAVAHALPVRRAGRRAARDARRRRHPARHELDRARRSGPWSTPARRRRHLPLGLTRSPPPADRHVSPNCKFGSSRAMADR